MNPERVYISHTKGRPAWNRGLDKSDPRVAKNSEAVKATIHKRMESGEKFGFAKPDFWTEERRKAKSEWRKQLHIDHPETHPNRRLAGNRKLMTYPERVAFDYLSKSGIEFKHQERIENFYVDFLIGNRIVEIDGEHWHDPEKDAVRDSRLVELGYTVTRIRSKERIEDRLRDFISA